jgi:hypothetical protein
MLNRIFRAVRLERTLYREVADHPNYMTEAFLIVLLVALISSIGTLIGAGQENGGGFIAYVAEVINQLLFGWLLWAVVSYFVGSTFFGGRSSVNEMLRVLAYATTPRLLGLFGFIWCIGPLLALVGWILSIAAAVVAIRESMEFDTVRALVTALIGYILFIIAAIVIRLFWAGITFPFRLF